MMELSLLLITETHPNSGIKNENESKKMAPNSNKTLAYGFITKKM